MFGPKQSDIGRQEAFNKQARAAEQTAVLHHTHIVCPSLAVKANEKQTITMEGRCQCGHIRFTTPTAQPSALYICHCTECRRQSSSTYGMTAMFPSFELTAPHANAIAVYSRPNSKGRTDGYFCTKCGSRIYHKFFSADGVEAAVLSVKAGCLDGITKEMMRSAIHIWVTSAVVDIPQDAEANEEEPPDGSGQ